MASKKGISATLLLFFYIFFAFIVAVAAGVIYFMLTTVNTSITGMPDIRIGNYSFQTVYTATLGAGITAFINTLQIQSLGLLIGMILVMFIFAYAFKPATKLLFIFDIMVMIVCEIVAIYIAQAFQTYVNANTDLLDIYSINIETTSNFVLNLPIIIPVIGSIMIALSYATIKKVEPLAPGEQ